MPRANDIQRTHLLPPRDWRCPTCNRQVLARHAVKFGKDQYACPRCGARLERRPLPEQPIAGARAAYDAPGEGT